MNDIDSNKNNKESNFKVYKNKLSSFISPKKTTTENPPQTKDKNIVQKATTSNNTKNTTDDQNKNENPSLEEIRQKIKSQAIKNNPSEKIETSKIQEKNNVQNSNIKKPKIKIEDSFIKTIIKVIIITLVALIVGYVIVNYQALSLRFSYWYEVDIEGKNWSETHPISLVEAQDTAQKLDENYLYIPMVDIQAPINWGIPEDDVSSMLSAGLVQYKASALPDDASGNIYIIGNTSGPIWSSGNYKTVFTLLDKAQTDHVITIIYKNKIYSYRIFEIEYLKNSNITISTGDEEQSILNLLAQYPIGLNWKTLRIRAELFKIESNIVESMQDKIKEIDDVYNSSQPELDPVEVQPTSTDIPIPTEDNLPNPEILPQHFLPEL